MAAAFSGVVGLPNKDMQTPAGQNMLRAGEAVALLLERKLGPPGPVATFAAPDHVTTCLMSVGRHGNGGVSLAVAKSRYVRLVNGLAVTFAARPLLPLSVAARLLGVPLTNA